MRPALFLCAVLGSPASAQQIGSTDPAFARVSPVQFCVDLLPANTPDDADLVTWTFPGGAPNPQPIAGNIVPARPGQAFGFMMQAIGPGRLDDITVVVDHPPLLDTGKAQHQWVASVPNTTISLSYYAFGRLGEATPGDWTFTYLKDDKVLYQHRFTLLDTGDDTLCADG